jgi:DNA-binding CsgD family transcriptional regulator
VGEARLARATTRDEDLRAQAEALARDGLPAAALALLTAAAEDVERDDPLAAAVTMAESSWYARLAYGPERALQLARRAAHLAAGADGPTELVVYSRLGDALQWNGCYAEAQSAWAKAASAAVRPEAHLLAARTDALLRTGDLRAARESAYYTAGRAREGRDPEALRDALTYQAIAEIHLGLLREADASAAALEAAAVQVGGADRIEALGLRAWIDALVHDEAICRGRVAATLAGAAELGMTPSQGMAEGLLALRIGRYAEAVSHLEIKLDGSTPLAAMLGLRPFLDALVEACMRSGRQPRASELAEDVLEPALATRQPRYVAIALRMQAVTSGDLDTFERALDEHARWGNRFEEARTRLLQGEALRRAKRRQAGREALSIATAAFVAVGATAWANRAREELRATGARLPREASGARLTPQEDRVARLVAEGWSNKEIAARLVLSPKTVEGHLRNIFGKLGARSRAQVASRLLP